MKINLPRGLAFDINNVPEDFDEQIRKAFHDYTDGTNPEYMFHDKLAFIDRAVELLRRSTDSYNCVKNLILESYECHLDNYGELLDKDDFNSIEFMEACWKDGKESQQLYGNFTGYSDDRRENDKIMKLLIRVMKIVLDYEE